MTKENNNNAPHDAAAKVLSGAPPKTPPPYELYDFVEIERNEACLQHSDGGMH